MISIHLFIISFLVCSYDHNICKTLLYVVHYYNYIHIGDITSMFLKLFRANYLGGRHKTFLYISILIPFIFIIFISEENIVYCETHEDTTQVERVNETLTTSQEEMQKSRWKSLALFLTFSLALAYFAYWDSGLTGDAIKAGLASEYKRITEDPENIYWFYRICNRIHIFLVYDIFKW